MRHTMETTIPTENAGRYLQQLAKHWSHKFDVTFNDKEATIALPEVDLAMTAQNGSLHLMLTSENTEELEVMKTVVAEHLDRFAFKEAPLPFNWQ